LEEVFVYSRFTIYDLLARCATGICQRIHKAHVFDEAFGVNSTFNAEVFIAAPHAVAMDFDLFGEAEWSLGGFS
jgi:hypothetical protein